MCFRLRLWEKVALRLNRASKDIGYVLRSISCINLNGNQDLFEFTLVENDTEVPPSSERKLNSCRLHHLTFSTLTFSLSLPMKLLEMTCDDQVLFHFDKTSLFEKKSLKFTYVISKSFWFASNSVRCGYFFPRDVSGWDHSYTTEARSSANELVDSTGSSALSGKRVDNQLASACGVYDKSQCFLFHHVKIRIRKETSSIGVLELRLTTI